MASPEPDPLAGLLKRLTLEPLDTDLLLGEPGPGSGRLFGGMVALERVFGYQGVGNLILRAVDRADYPVLQASVLAVAVIYMLATLSADLLVAWMNPRVRQTLGDN